MEKLLNLLQEFYGENRKFSNDDGLLTMTNGVENLSGAYAQTYIISKQGGFIKWLIENDKIDLWNKEYECYWNEMYKDTDTTDAIIMELSISDTPIEDLILYLK